MKEPEDILRFMYPRIIQPKFDEVFSYENLITGAYRCAADVNWKLSVQNYMNRLIENTSSTYNLLQKCKFRSPGFIHFVINERGKIRDINSVRIDERVVQKVLSEIGLRPIVVPRLLTTNCASLPGRGTSAALWYFKQDLAWAFRKYGKNCNILITDYHGYYDSIDHLTLLNQYSNWIEDENIFNLFAYFVSTFVNLNDESKTVMVNNSIDPSLSPAKKNTRPRGIYTKIDLELFEWYNNNPYFDENTTLDIGLGLGSEISQLSGISYVNHIDHGIKEKYRIEKYTRYMDDSYLIDPDIIKLKECYAYMQEESMRYGLTYNPKHTNFYKITDHYTFLKKKSHVDPETGKVVIKLSNETIVKHRHTFKNQRELLDNGRMTMIDIFNCFYSWRESVKEFDTYDILTQLTREFMSVYYDHLDPSMMKKLYKI